MDKIYTKEEGQLKEIKQVEQIYDYEYLIRSKERLTANLENIQSEIAKIDALLAECEKLGIGNNL